jgi:KRAB domain-containing zinc finger protein
MAVASIKRAAELTKFIVNSSLCQEGDKEFSKVPAVEETKVAEEDEITAANNVGKKSELPVPIKRKHAEITAANNVGKKSELPVPITRKNAEITAANNVGKKSELPVPIKRKHVEITAADNEEKKYGHPCTYCKETFTSKRKLKAHMAYRHKKKMKTCSKCHKAFQTFAKVKGHVKNCMSVAMEKETQKHQVNQKRTKEAGVVEKPKLAKTTKLILLDSLPQEKQPIGKAKNPCEYCQETFNSKRKLKIHMSYQHRGKLKNCAVCNISFSRFWLLKVHKKNVHSERPHFMEKYDVAKSESEASVQTVQQTVQQTPQQSSERPKACAWPSQQEERKLQAVTGKPPATANMVAAANAVTDKVTKEEKVEKVNQIKIKVDNQDLVKTVQDDVEDNTVIVQSDEMNVKRNPWYLPPHLKLAVQKLNTIDDKTTLPWLC